jgi:hypothetical protein
MPTDRDKIKTQDESVLSSTGLTSLKDAVASRECRPYPFLKTGSENAATNVAESPIALAPHACKAKKIGIQAASNVTSNAANYMLIKFFHRTNAVSTLFASWNTAPAAQGALTTSGPGVISTAATGLVANSDANIPANAGLYYTIEKYGTGQALATLSAFTLWLEEI